MFSLSAPPSIWLWMSRFPPPPGLCHNKPEVQPPPSPAQDFAWTTVAGANESFLISLKGSKEVPSSSKYKKTKQSKEKMKCKSREISIGY